MGYIRIFTGLLGTVALCLGAAAQTIPNNVGQSSRVLPAGLQNVGFDPQLNAQMPLDLAFQDEAGREVHLRDYFNHKPVVLAFVYYSCPMLCDQVQLGVAGSLKMLSFYPGRDYEVVFVSFDPHDNPEAAAQKKKMVLSRFGRQESENGWHFLSGSQASIDAVTKAANFRYALDPQTKTFAHASGVLLLTPEGRISRYFYGVEYPGRDVRLGLVDASAGKIGSPIDHLFLYCFHYNPANSRYSVSILRVMRLGGILTVLIIVGGIVIFRCRDLAARSNSVRPPVRGGSEQGAR